jgi:hypothetical protein
VAWVVVPDAGVAAVEQVVVEVLGAEQASALVFEPVFVQVFGLWGRVAVMVDVRASPELSANGHLQPAWVEPYFFEPFFARQSVYCALHVAGCFYFWEGLLADQPA